MHSHFFNHFISDNFEKIAQMLIERGADVNAVNDKNYSALIISTLKGNISD